MLKKRILTALVLMPTFVFVIVFLSPPAFCLVTGFLVLIAGWEWAHMMGLNTRWQCSAYLLLMALSMVAVFFISISIVLSIALLWWFAAFYCVARFTENGAGCGSRLIVRGAMGLLVLVPCWLALNVLRNTAQSTYILLFLFILVWTADSAAFFAGKYWGKHKMIPAVSPGKTWEGLMGGLAACILMAVIMLFIFNVPTATWPGALVLSVVTVLFSVLGDLFESMIKRQQGLKDSGQLLPGHGGFFDRIDSITAAAPVFTLAVLWMNK